LGTLDRDEVRLGLAGKRLGQQCLAGTGRAEKHDALGCTHPGLLEQRVVLELPQHDLGQKPFDFVCPADVIPPHV